MRHFPALLFGWFFFGMFLCGLLAPEDRVRELESSIITEGWHLSLMSLVFGGLVIAAYILRARKTESTPPPQ
jgi:hypothetical protein